jgi:hypothetical protein
MAQTGRKSDEGADDVPKLTLTFALTTPQYVMLQQAATNAGLPSADSLVVKAVTDSLGPLYRERALNAAQLKVESDVAALLAGVGVAFSAG